MSVVAALRNVLRDQLLQTIPNFGKPREVPFRPTFEEDERRLPSAAVPRVIHTSLTNTPSLAPNTNTAKRQPPDYRPLISAAEKKHGIPPGLLYSLAKVESNFDPLAVSKAGAKGIMQFMPDTAKTFNIDPFVPEQAIPAGAEYLAQNFKRFKSWNKALAAYNWGPTALERHGLGKAPLETREHNKKVLDEYRKLRVK